MSIDRVFCSVLTDDLAASRPFWEGWLGFEAGFESDWFVQLRAPERPALELGLILRTHETVPARFRQAPSGVQLTVVVDDVDALHASAQERGVSIVEPPTNMFYGQRRMLVTSPSGVLVDVSSRVP